MIKQYDIKTDLQPHGEPKSLYARNHQQRGVLWTAAMVIARAFYLYGVYIAVRRQSINNCIVSMIRLVNVGLARADAYPQRRSALV